MTDPDLDTLLAAARDMGPVPTDALIARVLADAAACQPRPARLSAARPAAKRPSSGWLDGLAAMFGGGGALAGISLAMGIGVFVGVAQPAPVAALTAALLVGSQADAVILFPVDTALWEDQQND